MNKEFTKGILLGIAVSSIMWCGLWAFVLGKVIDKNENGNASTTVVKSIDEEIQEKIKKREREDYMMKTSLSGCKSIDYEATKKRITKIINETYPNRSIVYFDIDNNTYSEENFKMTQYISIDYSKYGYQFYIILDSTERVNISIDYGSNGYIGTTLY